ncbi:hypothetical protein [Phytohabitans rumicis]|uniref:Uncharacterized protein n=1 Tax=Phytohabitans rumicis TaxID=1076125 RepID=A0A6V8LLD4_9ACTN|nr:hypothetical protein [Phytohabitans rumicis]GFJ95678.1 hypothetical protein Prum_093200 [Phytohabitans rumicis]
MADSPALDRVLRRAGGPGVLDVLAKALPGADLTTLLLAVFRSRAARLAPADVLRRYLEDRFAAPAAVPFAALRRAEDALLAALPPAFEPVALSPVAPLGTHSAVATVDQNKILTTVRGTEVAADPTNGLALEAARRRAASAPDVRLAAVQRVVRGQRFAAGAAHFGLFGLVTAGRDTGDLAFERRHSAEHLQAVTSGVRRATDRRPEVRLTVLQERFAPVAAAVREALAGVHVTDDPDRSSGRGYYTGLCFKVFVAGVEVGDGGFTDWTQRLLGNRKERLIISGVGVDRLATI